MPNFDNAKVFPYQSEQQRLQNYSHFDLMLHSKHYEAFAIKGEKDFTQRYAALRYVVANFNSLVAKVSADMLFGEKITVTSENQDFIEALIDENHLHTQLWESACSNAALGDAVFKIRTKDRNIIIEDTDPGIYFPHYDERNPRRKPEAQELAWTDTIEDQKYLIREIHRPGTVETRIFKLKETPGGDEIDTEISVKEYNAVSGTKHERMVPTGIQDIMLYHVPNTRLRGNKRFFGQSDFIELESLQFALNNRITKNDNILDKHSDPIVAVPEGVLDENGNVRKEHLGMIEITGEGDKPEYITWNANLEAAFTQIDKLVEFMFMVSETSPDVLGMGDGKAESGRALKMRLIRTLAKSARKRRYYETALKDMMWTAQELSTKGFTVGGQRVSKVEPVDISFGDGVVNDTKEMTEEAILKVEAGIMSPKTAAMELEGWDEEKAIEETNGLNREINTENNFPV
ncbi:MAG: phage portal protein [Candidatus Paceibacterota bacterium]